MGYWSSWISRALFGMLRLLENGKSRIVIIEFILLCDISSLNNSCRNCRFSMKGGIHCCCYFPGWGHQDTLLFPNPLVLALVEGTQGYFFPFFQNSHRGGSPCTAHPCGTANKPSGLMKKKKEKKRKRKVQHCAGFPLPSLSASSGSWEKSSRVESSCTKRRGRPGQGRVTWLLCGCEKPMKRKGWRKIFYLN